MTLSLGRKLLLAGLFLLAFRADAKDIPKQPYPPRLVNDFAGILSESENQTLENKLLDFSKSTTVQIAVVTEKSLDGDDIFDYSQRLFDGWGIGTKKDRNGALLYIAFDDHKTRIHTGYGLEATITDAASKRILETIIKPFFREGKYYEGIDSATNVMMALAEKDYKAEDYANGDEDGGEPTGIGNLGMKGILVVILIFFFIISIVNGLCGCGRRRRWGGLWGMPGPFFGGGWGGGSGGFGGGGGFGGFGGGSSGGGGASGNW